MEGPKNTSPSDRLIEQNYAAAARKEEDTPVSKEGVMNADGASHRLSPSLKDRLGGFNLFSRFVKRESNLPKLQENQMGQAAVLQNRINLLKNEMSEIESQRKEITHELKAKNTTIKEIEKEIKNKDGKPNFKILVRERALPNLKNYVKELEGQLAAKDLDLEKREAELASLQAQLKPSPAKKRGWSAKFSNSTLGKLIQSKLATFAESLRPSEITKRENEVNDIWRRFTGISEILLVPAHKDNAEIQEDAGKLNEIIRYADHEISAVKQTDPDSKLLTRLENLKSGAADLRNQMLDSVKQAK